jgi:hypothetical protein
MVVYTSQTNFIKFLSVNLKKQHINRQRIRYANICLLLRIKENYNSFKWIVNNKGVLLFFLFRFEFLTAMDITFFWDVTPCNSVEGCHISKESGIFIFGFIILLHDALRIYSMHKDLLSLLVLLSSFFNYLFIYIYLYIFIYIYINYLMC